MIPAINTPTPNRGLRILVIDDDDISREMMVDLLRGGGHLVWDLPSPIGATKHIVAEGIQVVVIDIMMPSMRGDKLAALLARNPKLKELGVVLVSGATVNELDALANEVRAAAIVSKTLMHTQLIPAVRRSVKPRTGPQPIRHR